jgi:L-serine dehydratase
MKSITSLFKPGYGPSSSHTMGPSIAAKRFFEAHPDALSFHVELLGSLAATGRGHLTDQAIIKSLDPKPCRFTWSPHTILPRHPNAMRFEALDALGKPFSVWTAYSVGGGTIVGEEESGSREEEDMYPHRTMAEVLAWCRENERELWEYVFHFEGIGLSLFLGEILEMMHAAIDRGLSREDRLPGGLEIRRRSMDYHSKAGFMHPWLSRIGRTFSYALAVAEENAGGGLVVTAPTCGSCGVLPAVLRSLREAHELNEKQMIRALATAGLIGTLVKCQGSISGAEVGCQGEIGTACAMGAAAAAQLMGASNEQIEYAAEMGLEHHLGLTCDPVGGLVQIPCIERNAVAATRALDAAIYAYLSDGRHRISLDMAIRTMKETGLDMSASYRETAVGGLARQHGPLSEIGC